MVSSLFGSGPKVTNNPITSFSPATNVTQPGQQQTLSQILQAILGQIQGAPGTFAQGATGGQFAAPVTPGQNALISDSTQLANETAPGLTSADYTAALGVPTGTQERLVGDILGAVAPGGSANAPLGSATSALTQILAGQPQDYSQYFTQDVAQPLENVFNERTLPGIKAAFARSAGGTNSVGDNTGYSAAVGQATEDLNRNLQQASTALSTQAITNAANNRVQGVGLAPGISQQTISNILQGLNATNFPTQSQLAAAGQGGANIAQLISGILNPALTAATVPQQTNQLQLSGANQQYNTGVQTLLQLLSTGAGASTTPTLGFPQPAQNTVVNPGQQGFFPSIAQGLAPGIGTGLGLMMLSDPKFKVIKGEKNLALETLNKLIVKEARYIHESEGDERPMLMADNVERIYPKAATRVNGVGYIKPAELIALLVKGVQELDKKVA